jgi:hypothetical protein
MKVVLDIETIPCSEEMRALLPGIEPPSSLSGDVSRLEKWKTDERPGQLEAQHHRTALDATYGRVFCIGLLPLDERNSPLDIVTLFGNDEVALLGRFWREMGKWKDPYIITHNGLQFDLPFLWKRSVVNSTRPSIELKLARFRTDWTFDTMAVWANWEPRSGIKLDTLAGILGVGQKSGTGAAVYDLWKAGRYQELAEYCAQDVYLTYACYSRMTFSECRPREAIKLSIEEVVGGTRDPGGSS